MSAINLIRKELMSKKLPAVQKRDGTVVPFDGERIRHAIRKAVVAVDKPSDEKADKVSHALAGEVVVRLDRQLPERLLVKNERGQIVGFRKEEPYGVEEIQVIVLETVHDDARRGEHSLCTHPLEVWEAYMYYMYGHIFVRDGKLPADRFTPDGIHRERVANITAWNEAHRCLTIDDLRRIFSNPRELRELIMAVDEERRKEADRTADIILGKENLKDIKMIIVTGPSSSGKTTTTKRLEQVLKEKTKGEIAGFRGAEIDMYFNSLSRQPKVEYMVDGVLVPDYNYEVPTAYDIPLLSRDLAKIMTGKEILLPHYDFVRGERIEQQTPFKLQKGEILLVDCLHAISPELTAGVPREQKFIVYIEDMNVLKDDDCRYVRWTDDRLLRRTLRDERGRGHLAKLTFMHWHFVRAGECFVFPYIYTADAVLNGGLPYSMPVLKHFLTGQSEVECKTKDGMVKKRIDIRDMLPVFERNEDIFDGRERLKRVLSLFEQLPAATLKQIAMIAPDSILREFIGGSTFFEGKK